MKVERRESRGSGGTAQRELKREGGREKLSWRQSKTAARGAGGGGGGQESLRWEKTEMVRARERRRELNIQQLCPDLLTLCVHALNVP